ncbi:MAG: hypothetical protein A2V88_04780 [Elusimicrobia bacterium RBG_16_66_12]|nr:MAG: hypothetical protein A2V88_04780 [Elusimicrobia bacterium RBG_16_66_12]
MNEERFRAIVRELIDENPLAIRAVLKILAIEFTDSVPTLAVTREERPRLLVNLAFVAAHCANDAQVKAVICHEFLHVLLRHTEGEGRITLSEHLAADAVINAIIHRQLGPEYSAMMSAYYADSGGLMRLLRPLTQDEERALGPHKARCQATQLVRTWQALYEGKLVADDIREVAEQAFRGMPQISLGQLLGDHDGPDAPLSPALREALDDCLKAMNGAGIWRSPKSRGTAAPAYDALFTAKDEAMARWRRSTLEVLKRHLIPDRRAPVSDIRETSYRLPVLSSKDRRAFIRALWDRFLPEATWETGIPRRSGLAQVYLDVSGSMSAEMPQLIALLNHLRRHIKAPFWAFSDQVAPAVIEGGQLRTRTSGGTSLACVLEHLAQTRPPAAVVITDGFIEELPPELVRKAAGVKLHAIVSRDGNPALLERAGISYTQLDRRPS